MSGKIEARLAELGITLPVPAVPVANYVPYAVTGNLVYTSGQVPVADGAVVWKGKVGGERSIEDGAASDAHKQNAPSGHTSHLPPLPK